MIGDNRFALVNWDGDDINFNVISLNDLVVLDDDQTEYIIGSQYKARWNNNKPGIAPKYTKHNVKILLVGINKSS